MGFIDKLKNVFFEEEEIEEEVETAPKLARKIEIPKKKVVQPVVKEEVEEPVVEEPKVIDVEEKVVEIEEELPNNKFSMLFEEDDFVLEEPSNNTVRDTSYERVERRTLYPEKHEETYSESVKKDNNYGYTKSYYEAKETKTFTPSPIISPIYGILNKNYKKEEVITRKEIKITTSREKIDLDSVRNKAFGDNLNDNKVKEEKVLEKKKVEEQENVKEEKIYNVNTTKPSVKGITLEDADEYYHDLGLAYNEDYSDKARETTKKKSDRLEDNLFDLIESMYDKED